MNGMEAPRMVRCLISRLAETGEEDWVGWLCCELAVQVCIYPVFLAMSCAI